MGCVRGIVLPLFLIFLIGISSTEASELKGLFAKALIDEQWQDAADYGRRLLKESPEPALLASVGYALYRAGDKKEALRVLSADRAEITGLVTDALKAAPVAVVFVRTGDDGLAIGVVPKTVEVRALKRLFYGLDKEPSQRQIERFRERVLGSRDGSRYIVAAAPVVELEDGTLYIVLIDLAAFQDAIEGRAKESFPTFGVLTQRGKESYRKDFIQGLREYGYRVKDLGRGDFYTTGDRAKGLDVVIELSEEVRSDERLLGGRFKEFEARVELTLYSVSPKRLLWRLKEDTRIVHLDDIIGSEAALKESYQKALARLYSRMDALKRELEALGAKEPPIKVSVEFDRVFASNYKYYAKYPVGTVVLKNTTDRSLGDITLSIEVKRYMDYPTLLRLGRLDAGKTIKRPLNMVFNRHILDITDNTFIQSAIKVSYVDEGRQHTITLNSPIYVYEKHALLWDDKGKLASFITPRDPVVVSLATAVVRDYRADGLWRNLQKAGVLFETLGVLGISYMEDPNTPFSVVSGLKRVVDFVQFPRETLARKVGDCDDLTSLYSSLLESIGIRTALIDVPGHVFIMFDTAVPEEESLLFGFPEDSYIIYKGTLWLPVETTLVGASFSEAWRAGVRNYRGMRKRAKIISLEEARRLYLAPNLPPKSLELNPPVEKIKERFRRELKGLKKKRLDYLKQRLTGLGTVGVARLVAIYAKEGMLDEALSVAESIEGRKEDPALLNNVGNIYYLKRMYREALRHYRRAYRLDNRDANILVNIARTYLKLGNRRQAKEYLNRAIEIDRTIKDRYIGLYTEING